jgi:hypothetical protein
MQTTSLPVAHIYCRFSHSRLRCADEVLLFGITRTAFGRILVCSLVASMEGPRFDLLVGSCRIAPSELALLLLFSCISIV